jgi:hypothetical protein
MGGPPSTGWRFKKIESPARRKPEGLSCEVFLVRGKQGSEMPPGRKHRKVKSQDGGSSQERFFNKKQVTCVGARVGEFAINESDHALIKCNREQGTAFS